MMKALFNTGVTLERLNRIAEAVAVFEHCAERNPEHPEVWYELGFCYDRVGA